MSQKKILIVTEYFYPEEFKINEVAVAWRDKGYAVDILTQNPTYPYGEVFEGYTNRWYTVDEYEGMKVYRVKAVKGYKSSLFKKLLKYATFMFLGSFVALKIGKKHDFVFGFDVGALSGMVPAVLLKKFYGKRVVLWIQDVWPDSVYAYGFKKTKVLAFFLEGFVRFVYRNCDAFAVSGKGFIKRVKPYVFSGQEIVYLPNWADALREECEKLSLSEDKKVHFTFAGNIGTVQNLDNIIEAFGFLDEKYSNKAQLNIIGDGSHLEALKALVVKRNFSNIVFWGRKPKDEMNSYFQASDFLIVSLVDKPIFSLTVPAKLQTYIAASKPILAVINGDAADIVRDNNLGYCAAPDNIAEIQQVFIEAIETPKQKLNEFSRNAHVLTTRDFNKEKIIDGLLHLLKG